jgi:DNA (cytosine-5)-methyltransferase 1
MSSARNTPGAQIGMGVRRLTPLECERLMGWPDEWTRYTSDGQEISDSHRYRMCGNGIIATMAEWLGHRLIMADSLEKVLQSDSA